MTNGSTRMVETINVLDVGNGDVVSSPLFGDKDVQYVIPIYQRAFAWGTGRAGDINYENEIERLMDDIHDLEKDKDNYYIGSLVVCRRESSPECPGRSQFEVIDGQQRLTALFIVLKCLKEYIGDSAGKIPFESVLDYDCRDKSENAIEMIDTIIKAIKTQNWEKVHEEKEDKEKNVKRQWQYDQKNLENSICDGVRTVIRRFEEKTGYSERLFENLKKVRLFRIEVPEGTDLNKYFEIMNVRGRQLEQSDIVKARLMNWLESEEKKKWFARIWNACKDMSGYVQMRFDKSDRDVIFGKEWNTLPDTEAIQRVMGKADDSTIGKISVVDAILNPEAGSTADLMNENGNQEDSGDGRFSSIIEFPHFLLHVLKVFLGKSETTTPTDARFLVKTFEQELQLNIQPTEKKAKRVWEFVICLLRCRFLFDKYFIKRDYAEDPKDGTWSLSELQRTSDKSWKYKPVDSGKGCLMIQSCLRVSHTETKRMHWVSQILGKLYEESERKVDITLQGLVSWGEQIATCEAREDWKKLEAANYCLGTKTPHLLFNYLDYLLWKKTPDQSFVFTFRNSVEHWYPQHPSQGTIPNWDSNDGHGSVDRFGNLCLIESTENSKFSNRSPAAKITDYKKTVFDGSLKLRAMANMTPAEPRENMSPAEYWRTVACERHENDMISYLKEGLR